MLKKIKDKIHTKRTSDLKGTPSDNIRNEIIKAGIKAAQESGYAPGNTTEKFVSIASSLGTWVDRGTELISGGEAGGALGNITFKTVKDIRCNNNVCTGLCLASGTCETVALCCSTIKVIPFRGKIYVTAKVISKTLMTYRNAYAGEGC